VHGHVWTEAARGGRADTLSRDLAGQCRGRKSTWSTRIPRRSIRIFTGAGARSRTSEGYYGSHGENTAPIPGQ